MPVYEVQTNAIECEYNMPQFNMIQENTTNVSINSKTNNNIVITENKKEEIKKPEKKAEITPKKDIEKEKPKENVVKKEEINTIYKNGSFPAFKISTLYNSDFYINVDSYHS